MGPWVAAYATSPAPPQVQCSIAADGRVERATDVTAVLTDGTRPNHVLHLLLTVTTADYG